MSKLMDHESRSWGDAKPRDLTLRGGRRRRRRYVVGMWLTVLVFTALVLILTNI